MTDNAPVAGNREKALVSKAWNWALSRDLTTLPNPWKLTTRNPEEANKHYVADQDWYAWKVWVIDNCPVNQYLWIIPELMYLCRMRKIELLTATKAQILPEGFDTIRRKGSQDVVTKWSERLREAIDATLALPLDKGMETVYLFHDKRGAPIKESTFDTAWQRNMKRCIAETGIRRFRPHLSKHKGTTDRPEGMSATGATGNTIAAADIYDFSKPKREPSR